MDSFVRLYILYIYICLCTLLTKSGAVKNLVFSQFNYLRLNFHNIKYHINWAITKYHAKFLIYHYWARQFLKFRSTLLCPKPLGFSQVDDFQFSRYCVLHFLITCIMLKMYHFHVKVATPYCKRYCLAQSNTHRYKFNTCH